MKKHKILILVGILGAVLLSTSCRVTPTEITKEAQYTKDLMAQMADEVGMPAITEYTEKKLAKMILEKRDDANLVTYVYEKNMDGRFIYISQAIGFGLPYSTQYTQPETIQRVMVENTNMQGEGRGTYSEHTQILPQADPNGLYVATGLSATWLQLIDDATGEVHLTYYEPEIIVSEYKLPASLVEPWSIEGRDY